MLVDRCVTVAGFSPLRVDCRLLCKFELLHSLVVPNGSLTGVGEFFSEQSNLQPSVKTFRNSISNQLATAITIPDTVVRLGEAACLEAGTSAAHQFGFGFWVFPSVSFGLPLVDHAIRGQIFHYSHVI